MSKKKKKLKEYLVTFKISGRGTATVEAESEEEVWENFHNLNISNEEVMEWNYEDVTDVESNE